MPRWTGSLREIFKKDGRTLALAGGLALGFVWLASWLDRPTDNQVEAPREAVSVDTLIPAGFLLIPIEVQNYESLDSLLGKMGVVDLFKGSDRNGHLVARNIRILRAPQNPSHFAVLAPEAQAGAILSEPGNFYVAIKSPSQSGTQFVNQAANKKRILFDGD